MPYHLLTGATGLLGSYLLRDLMVAGQRVAVLVRSNKIESARQRIEAIMARWDKQAGHTLPRPVILQGSLSNEQFDLSDEQLQWVSENCDSIVQNAASVTYYGKRPDEEPWRTNINGTANALAFCRHTGIRHYHHVSTAYVCGKRDGLVYESELDKGQEMNTDYERSKLEGELMVRAADHIHPPTIYRVAIIIGDSQTGYTPTFHGFYVPLKLVHTMFRHIMRDDLQAGPLQESIQIQGHERKNLVPVNLVSEVMTHMITNPQHHGKTYHLAPEKPATANIMRDAMAQGFLTYSDLTASADHQDNSWTFNQDEFVSYFRNQMKIYESYWKDDPQFDLTNTRRAAPHLPCPEVNCEMLVRLCKFAIESNFGWPRPAPVQLKCDVTGRLGKLLQESARPSQQAARVGLQVNGPGGGQWEIFLDQDRPVGFRHGLSADCHELIYLNSNTFDRLTERRVSVQDCLHQGQITVEGKDPRQKKFLQLLEQIVHN